MNYTPCRNGCPYPDAALNAHAAAGDREIGRLKPEAEDRNAVRRAEMLKEPHGEGARIIGTPADRAG